jgi:hypothetical protein
MNMRKLIVIIFLITTSCMPAKYYNPTLIPSLTPSIDSIISSDLAYRMQNYGSPDGKWIIDATEPRARITTVYNSSVLSSTFILNPGEYTVFAGWSPDSTAFMVYEASYHIGCPLQRLAIYTLNDRSLSRAYYQPKLVGDDGSCMRAAWSPDGKAIAIIMGSEVFTIDRQGNPLEKVAILAHYNKSSIENFQWTGSGFFYVEKKHDDTLDDRQLRLQLQHAETSSVIHFIDSSNHKQKDLLENYYGLSLVGVVGNSILVVVPASWNYEDFVHFEVIDIASAKIISDFNISGLGYCGAIVSPSATIVLAIARGPFCSYMVNAVAVNLDSKNMVAINKEYGEIFGLLRWDEATSRFLVLRGSTQSGLWIDKIKP